MSGRHVGGDRTRWFPRSLQPCAHLVNKYLRERLPLMGYIEDREGYDETHHAEVGSSNAAFVGPNEANRPLREPGGPTSTSRAARAGAAGVDQFNLILMNGDEEDQPRLTAVKADPGATGRRREPMRSGAIAGRVITCATPRVACR